MSSLKIFSLQICRKGFDNQRRKISVGENIERKFLNCSVDNYRRRLNLQTVPDRYPLPNLHDLSACLHGSTVFSKLDLVKGYYQVPVTAAYVPKTTIMALSLLLASLSSPRCPSVSYVSTAHGPSPQWSSIFFCLPWWHFGGQSGSLHSPLSVLDIFQAKGLLVNLAKCFLPNPLSPAWSTPSLLPASLPSPLMLMPFVSILFPPLSRICSVFLASLILPLFSSSCHHYTPTPHCCPRWKSPISHMVNWSLAMLAAFHHIKEVLGSATLFFHPHPTAPIWPLSPSPLMPPMANLVLSFSSRFMESSSHFSFSPPTNPSSATAFHIWPWTPGHLLLPSPLPLFPQWSSFHPPHRSQTFGFRQRICISDRTHSIPLHPLLPLLSHRRLSGFVHFANFRKCGVIFSIFTCSKSKNYSISPAISLS